MNIELIKSQLLQIQDLDLELESIEGIKVLLDPIIKGHKLSCPNFHPGLKLYRGIKYDIKPEFVSQLSYPPKEFAKISRASREGESLFYCANSNNVPYYELGGQIRDKLVISQWETTRNLLVNNIGYTDSNFLKLQSNRTTKNVWTSKPETSTKLETREDIVQNFLATAFSQEAKNTSYYKLTVAIAELHIGGTIIADDNIKQYIGDSFAGFMYPTIQMNANADNFAIKPQIIDTGGLSFVDVFFIEITNIIDLKFEIRTLDWANSISPEGRIEWKGRLPQWQLKGDENVTLGEDGQWIVKDNNGRLIAPN